MLLFRGLYKTVFYSLRGMILPEPLVFNMLMMLKMVAKATTYATSPVCKVIIGWKWIDYDG